MSESATIYLRISDDPSGERAGVERQERDCRALCEQRGWEVSAVYVDNDISATTGAVRPDFEALLASRPERIVVWATDRLVRVSRDLERVLDLGCNVHAVELGKQGDLDLSTPGGRAVARTLTAWATFEGEHKVARMQAAHRQRVDRGVPWWGTMPYGYRRDDSGKIVLHEEQAARIRDAYARLARGESFASLARLWAGEGVLVAGRARDPETGRQRAAQVPPRADYMRQLLRHPRNAGILTTGTIGKDLREVGPGGWPAIIPEVEWRPIVERAGQPENRAKGQGKRKALLTGIVVCGVCKGTLRQRWRPAAGGGKRYTYGAECGHASAPRDWLDDYVGRRIVGHLSSPAGLLRRQRREQGDGDPEGDMARLKVLRERLGELSEAFADGEINRAQLARASAKINTELEPLEEAMRRIPTGPEILTSPYTGPAQLLRYWRESEGDLDQRRLVVLDLVRVLEIRPTGRGRRMTDEHVNLEWR